MRKEAEDVWKSIAAGAIGGLVGSLAMNQFQAAVSTVSESMAKKERERKGESEREQKSVSAGDDVTVKTANVISNVVFDHELTDKEKKWAGPAVHYGFGMTLGAIYASLAAYTPVEAGAGTAYGTAVWVGADEIAVPSLGLSGPARQTPLSGHVKALASHLVFGLITHLTRKLVLS